VYTPPTISAHPPDAMCTPLSRSTIALAYSVPVHDISTIETRLKSNKKGLIDGYGAGDIRRCHAIAVHLLCTLHKTIVVIAPK